MDTDQDVVVNPKKKAIVHLTILAVVIGLIVIVVLLASSNFDFVDFVVKLHGG